MNVSSVVQSGEILYERARQLGLVMLNRPTVLNALTAAMTRSLDAKLRAWAADPQVQCVAIAGAGERAFCAGGDVRALYDARAARDRAFYSEFYFNEYRLNQL